MAMLTALQYMAQRLIAQEGQDCTVYLVDMGEGNYDPVTGTNTQAAPTKVDTKAVFLNVQAGRTMFVNTLIEKEDKEVYLSSAATFARKPNAVGDYITDASGTKWRIVVVRDNNPTGSAEIMYDLLVRR